MKHARWNHAVVWLFLAGILSAGEHVLPLQVHTGFFERQDALATATLELGRPLDMAKAVLRGKDGEKQVAQGELPTQMFEGSGLGLALAALPLADDFEARLPVAMNLGLTDELTLYNVRVRVSGKEIFPRKGKKEVEAWIVDVDWEDFETGEVTAAGGPDSSGGSYFVVPDPPKGFPHVPRYQNEGGAIELVFED